MPYMLTDLVVDRVDLVDEGANSAAFIELYKRKEIEEPMDISEILSKMKPEHAEVIQKALDAKDEEIAAAKEETAAAKDELDTANQNLKDKDEQLNAANDALDKANAELEAQKASGKDCSDKEEETDKSASFDEAEVVKAMPEAARELFEKMRAQKEAAEEQVRKAAEEKAEAEAIAKAASLKAIPVEQDKLAAILKSCSAEVADLLTTINSAIEASVLDEVGKNKGNGAKEEHTEDAWSKLEKKAEEIAKRDSVTKEKAMSKAVSENPDLYREYLNGGAK